MCVCVCVCVCVCCDDTVTSYKPFGSAAFFLASSMRFNCFSFASFNSLASLSASYLEAEEEKKVEEERRGGRGGGWRRRRDEEGEGEESMGRRRR